MSQENQPVGTSEHDQEMIRVAEERGGQPASEESRPEWLPEKFKSPEDMAKAYSELEKKLGSKPAEEENSEDSTEENNSEEAETSEDSKEEKNVEEGKLDFDKYSEEVAKDGKLSDESMAQLEKAGIPKEIVQAYIDGQQVQSQSQVSRFYDVAGGEEAFGKVAKWAAENADQGLVAAYDKAINNGDLDTAYQLFTSITQSYKNTVGSEGRSITGSPASDSGDVFESWQQVSVAMSDPRYSGPRKDPAYVKSVEQKIARSKNLN